MQAMNELLRFQNLSRWPEVVHGVSDRHVMGNVSFEHGSLSDVLCARSQLLGMLNEGNKGAQKLASLVSARQTHSDHIFVYREGDKLPQGFGAEGEISDIDAFVTDVPGVGFMVKTADCQPILMVGRRKKSEDRSQNGIGNKEKFPSVISLVHSGWRGSLKNIAGKTVRTMVEAFGVDPASIEVGVGPSIGPCCAEFTDAKRDFPEWALRYQVERSKRFDFWQMTRDQLRAEGVHDKAMEFCGICTVCHKDRWFSFRGDQPDCGRFGSVIGLVSSDLIEFPAHSTTATMRRKAFRAKRILKSRLIDL